MLDSVHFHPATTIRMLAFVYGLMSVALWVLFKHMNAGRGALTWFLAMATASLGALLISMRGEWPNWVSIHLANLLVFAAYGAATISLRTEVELPSRRLPIMAGVVLVSLAFLAAAQHSPLLRFRVGVCGHALGAALMALTGAQAARVTSMRSVRLIGVTYMVYAVALVLMAIFRTGNSAQTNLVADGDDPARLLALLAGTAAGVYGTLGYIGMAMERLRANDVAQATALAGEEIRRASAEQTALQLQAWLAERDDLVRVLAHEVRQPLNNASAALQAARAALAPVDDDRRMQPSAAEHRVQRAQSVLNQVIGSLDNTLAATALLASPDRVAQHDTDVDLLLQLSLGDLDTAHVHRVRVERLTGTRTAAMDAGLMRLALRNLLHNALLYSDPGSSVVLRVSDSDEPLALVFEVIDSGPGVEPELAPRLFQRGERGRHEQPGHGLGLYVVLRVAQLHGSRVEMQHREGGGSVFRFSLIQGRR